MHKLKYLFLTIVGIALLAGGTYGVKYGISEYYYHDDMHTISASYLSYKDKSLHANLNLSKLNSIPHDYHKIFPKKATKLKLAYRRIFPLYTLQADTQQGVTNLFDGKNNYANHVDKPTLVRLDKQADKINNDNLRSDLVNKIDKIDLWYTQTKQAQQVINKIYQNNSVSFASYVQAKANYSLIKNRKIKQNCQKKMKHITALYLNQKKKTASKNKKEFDSAVAIAKKSAETKLPYTPAKVNINLITKSDQKYTDLIQSNNILASKVVYIDTDNNNMHLLVQSDKYYHNTKTIQYSGNSPDSGTYSAKLTVNSGQNGLDNYKIDGTGALLTDNSDDTNPQWSVLNTKSDFNTDASYIKLRGNSKLLLAVDSDKYIVFSSDDIDDADINLTLSSEDYKALVQFCDSNTKMLVK